MMKSDVEVVNHGSIFLVFPKTDEAKDWITEHVPEDAPYFGNALAVEEHYISDLVDGMIGDGLVVE